MSRFYYWSVARAQKALEEQLRARVPHVLQGHIRGILHSELVGRENHATILAQHREPKISQDILFYSCMTTAIPLSPRWTVDELKDMIALSEWIGMAAP